MENFFTRYRNFAVLVLVVLAQVVGLATQVKRNSEASGTRLLRLWVVIAITPVETALVNTSQGTRNVWHNYFYLRGVRHENRELKAQLEQLRIEQVRLSEDAAQARRLQALLGFKEQYISHTVAAQVIGTSGSDQSHVIYIDKGANDGIKPDMAVITPDGIVGKVLRVFYTSAQVLMINDPSSGVGAILEKSRLQGILQGTASGETVLRYVMSDEKVEAGERILTSGGDRIFPKGIPIGTVTRANPGSDLFLNVRVRPSAELNRLEEVLVVTKVVETAPEAQQAGEPIRASDILAQRLPSVPPKTDAKGTKTAAAAGTKPAEATAGPTGTPAPASATQASTPAGTKPPATATGSVQATGGATNVGSTSPAVPKPATAKPSTGQATGAAANAGNTNSAVPKPLTAKPTSNVSSQSGAPQNGGAPPAAVKPASTKTKQINDSDKAKPPDSAVPPPKPATPPASNQEIPR